MSKTIVKVYFNNGCSSLLYNETTTVQDLIRALIKGRLCQNELRYKKCYMIRATKYTPDNLEIVDFFWLSNNYRIKDVLKLIECEFESWKLVLRVRFLPSNLDEVRFKDRVTFIYYYEQVKNDFMMYKVKNIDIDQNTMQIILDLGCLEMRRSFQNMKPNSLDKKINFEYLEKDVGLKRFFPDSILQQKSKTIKKLIIKGLKEYEQKNEEECMLIYLEKLKSLWKYFQETYECHLGATWSVPIKLVVNYEFGVSCYMKDPQEVAQSRNGISGFKMFQNVLFENIVQLNVTNDVNNGNLVQLKLNKTDEPLVLKLTDKNTASNLALLIDGYCMLKTNSDVHIWPERNESGIVNSQERPRTVISRNTNSLEIFNSSSNDDNGEYTFIDNCYEIDRNLLDFVELLGSGQFGDVYKGTFQKNKNEIIEVAIKALKTNDNEQEDKDVITNKFMQEARIMQSFDHPHIIKLIGICSDYPSLIVMELAKYGQLRKYLQVKINNIEIATLISYCYQLNTAMTYLESKKFVHRDIAARNVLVFDTDCVKLSDFGLSRAVEENFYLASKSKLPIKWLAPESINFRKFTSSSDVWMFGVCMWEILSFGEKPFQNIKNSDVIHLIENKERLPKPLNCPQELYSVMLQCWEYEPLKRPKFSQLHDTINSIYMTYKETKVMIASYDLNKSTQNIVDNESSSFESFNTKDSLPPPKPKRNINVASKLPTSKFQFPSIPINIDTTPSQEFTNLKISTNTQNSIESNSNLFSDSIWLDEKLKNLNTESNHLKNNSSNKASSSSNTSINKDIELRDRTYNFIQRISNFVHLLSKSNVQLDNELKSVVYSWNDLCDTYETYPVILSKSKKITESVEELESSLSNMVDELKSNNLEKVMNIALDLARKASQLFTFISS